MAERDVVDVDEDLVATLTVPDLPARVARVREDRAHGALGPGLALAVPVARRVVCRWRGDAVAGEAFGDRVEAGAGEVLGVDARDDRRCGVIALEAMETLADRRLARVRVRARVAEQVAVRRAATQEAALAAAPGRSWRCGPGP